MPYLVNKTFKRETTSGNVGENLEEKSSNKLPGTEWEP
jgi:hypothetical protein